MSSLPHNEWVSHPIHLLPDEIINPYSFIKSFYTSSTDIIQARRDLKRWLRSGFADRCLLKKKEMPNSLYFHDEIVKLLESTNLIQHKISQIIISEKIDSPKDLLLPDTGLTSIEPNHIEFDYLPRYLSGSELANPYNVLRKLFIIKSLPEWREILKDLLSASFGPETVLSYSSWAGNPLKLADCLFKLLEASHLIKTREIDKII